MRAASKQHGLMSGASGRVSRRHRSEGISSGVFRVTDQAETPRERRARYLQLARAAEEKAQGENNLEIREQLLEIAVQWALLAEELDRKATRH